ncbi:MAG: hypothetical protein A6F70_03155 [Cycloclasticus sp. symbiont of Bathymodiolus heckerae]|nr:MAG: hypothetical protein A6F70_03155 [Cycloclasticus sp. symbiont of Bathymodiolus heckerae]
MSFKKQVKMFLLTNVSVVTFLTIGLGAYDPLHIFHKSWITDDNRLHGDMRMQAAGVINNYAFDSIIVGTSMLKGMSASLTSEKLGGVFVNLSPNGASIAERKHLINYALKKKAIKSVIVSFDTGLDQNLIRSNAKFPVTKFSYLYDDASINDVKAYWNYKFIGCLASLSTSTACYGNKRAIQRPLGWFEKVQIRNAKISGIESWVHAEGGRGKNINSRIKRHIKSPIKSQAKYDEKLKLTQEIIDDSLFSLIKENEGASFHVLFPPYSRFLYSLWKNKNPYKYQLYLETIRHLVVEGAKYKNLKVYSFDDMGYLDNLNNYRDMRHYNTDMNNVMLDSIKDKKRVIRVSNLEAFIEKIDKKNASYAFDVELNYLLNSYKGRR